MPKSRKLLFITVLLLLVVGYFFFSNKPWPTYENSRYGFSVSYPPSWKLGEAEVGNSGRSFTSEDGSIYCYAYGFPNALLGESGNHQTLDEFITWLLDDSTLLEVVESTPTTLAGTEAKHIVLVQEDGMLREATYSLNSDRGLGIFCLYKNKEAQLQSAKTFSKIVGSFSVNTNSQPANSNLEDCQNLLNGLVTPLKDQQFFEDTTYTEVSLLPRESWDRGLLPEPVVRLEDTGYTCYPMPKEFKDSSSQGVNSEPEVLKIEWSCELGYVDFSYLATSDSSGKDSAESSGLVCQEAACLEYNAPASVWLCTR